MTDLSGVYLGFCLGAFIWLPIGAVGWWFVLGMCASAAKADKAMEEAAHELHAAPKIQAAHKLHLHR